VVYLEEKKWCHLKFSPSAVEALLIGFNNGHKTYKLWVPSSKQIKISHHVQFYPTEFPSCRDTNPHSSIELWANDLFVDNVPTPVEKTPQPPSPETTPLEIKEIEPSEKFLAEETPEYHEETPEENIKVLPPLPVKPTAVKGYTYVVVFHLRSNAKSGTRISS
jgi:hypothetical protein